MFRDVDGPCYSEDVPRSQRTLLDHSRQWPTLLLVAKILPNSSMTSVETRGLFPASAGLGHSPFFNLSVHMIASHMQTEEVDRSMITISIMGVYRPLPASYATDTATYTQLQMVGTGATVVAAGKLVGEGTMTIIPKEANWATIFPGMRPSAAQTPPQFPQVLV